MNRLNSSKRIQKEIKDFHKIKARIRNGDAETIDKYKYLSNIEVEFDGIAQFSCMVTLTGPVRSPYENGIFKALLDLREDVNAFAIPIKITMQFLNDSPQPYNCCNTSIANGQQICLTRNQIIDKPYLLATVLNEEYEFLFDNFGYSVEMVTDLERAKLFRNDPFLFIATAYNETQKSLQTKGTKDYINVNDLSCPIIWVPNDVTIDAKKEEKKEDCKQLFSLISEINNDIILCFILPEIYESIVNVLFKYCRDKYQLPNELIGVLIDMIGNNRNEYCHLNKIALEFIEKVLNIC